MTIPRIAFICVNFNNSSYTTKYCESLAQQQGKDSRFLIDCFVVDNSTDDADSRVLSEFVETIPWIQYLRTKENLGYFGGLNYGLKHVETNIYSYVIIGNNDLVFDPMFCLELSGSNRDARVFAICPDVITKDGVHQNPHLLTRMGRWRRFQLDVYFAHYYFARLLLAILGVIRPVKASPPQPASACEIHMGIGACYVLTKAFLHQFTQLYYPHFLYGEEAYFSDQIHSVGGILWFDPVLRVHHAESATLSQVPKRTSYEFARAGYSSYRKML